MSDLRRVLVTGPRDWTGQLAVDNALLDTWHDALEDGADGIIVVHGACMDGQRRVIGVDGFASRWAQRHKAHGVIEEAHPAENFGPWPQCGPIRNQHMVRLGAAVALAFIGPCTRPKCRQPQPHTSHGATGCADLAQKADIPTRRYTA